MPLKHTPFKLNTLTGLAAQHKVMLSKSEAKTLESIDKFEMWSPTGRDEARKNPYSGVEHMLNPLLVGLYDFIIDSHNNHLLIKIVPVNLWNKARYLFLRLDSQKFYDLID